MHTLILDTLHYISVVYIYDMVFCACLIIENVTALLSKVMVCVFYVCVSESPILSRCRLVRVSLVPSPSPCCLPYHSSHHALLCSVLPLPVSSSHVFLSCSPVTLINFWPVDHA